MPFANYAVMLVDSGGTEVTTFGSSGVGVSGPVEPANPIGGSLEDVLAVDVSTVTWVSVQFRVSVAALTGFTVSMKQNTSGNYILFASVAAHYTAPGGRIIATSGHDLTTAASGTTDYWLDINTAGMSDLLLQATSAGSATIAGYYGGN